MRATSDECKGILPEPLHQPFEGYGFGFEHKGTSSTPLCLNLKLSPPFLVYHKGARLVSLCQVAWPNLHVVWFSRPMCLVWSAFRSPACKGSARALVEGPSAGLFSPFYKCFPSPLIFPFASASTLTHPLLLCHSSSSPSFSPLLASLQAHPYPKVVVLGIGRPRDLLKNLWKQNSSLFASLLCFMLLFMSLVACFNFYTFVPCISICYELFNFGILAFASL